MTPSSITPHTDLQGLLTGKILVNSKPIKVYTQGERPSTETPSEFIEILQNGSVSTPTNSLDTAEGALALAIYISSNNGVINIVRAKYILSQVETLVHNVSSDKFFFSIDTNNIMETNNNLTISYSATVLNIKWHVLSGITL